MVKPYFISSYSRPHLGIGADDRIEFSASSREEAWEKAKQLMYDARRAGRHFPHPVRDAYRIHNFLHEGVFKYDEHGVPSAKFMEYRRRPGDCQDIHCLIDQGGWIDREGNVIAS